MTYLNTKEIRLKNKIKINVSTRFVSFRNVWLTFAGRFGVRPVFDVAIEALVTPPDARQVTPDGVYPVAALAVVLRAAAPSGQRVRQTVARRRGHARTGAGRRRGRGRSTAARQRFGHAFHH